MSEEGRSHAKVRMIGQSEDEARVFSGFQEEGIDEVFLTLLWEGKRAVKINASCIAEYEVWVE